MKSVHTKSFLIRLLLRFYVSDVSFKVSCPNLKFSDVLEFLRIPLGLNSALLEDAEGWRSVWQLEDAASISMASMDPASRSWRSTLRSSSLEETVSRSRAWLRRDLLLRCPGVTIKSEHLILRNELRKYKHGQFSLQSIN